MSCVGYRSSVFIKQMNPMAMTASVVAIMLRRVGKGGFFCEARLLFEANP